MRIKPALQTRDGRDDFKSGTRRISAVDGAVDLRHVFWVVQRRPLAFRDARHIIIGVKRRRGSHDQNIAVAHIHHHHRAAGIGLGFRQRPFRHPLQTQVDRQVHILAGFIGRLDVFALAVVEAVDQHQLDPGPPAQFSVKNMFHTRFPFVIGQGVGNLFRLKTFPLHIAQHMRGQGAPGIIPRWLRLYFQFGLPGQLFSEPGALRGSHIGHNLKRNIGIIRIVPQEGIRIEDSAFLQ